MSYNSLYNDANAARLDMENITSTPGVPSPKSQQILRQLRDNDPTLTRVFVSNDNDDYADDHCVYNAWLGYFIGKNNHLQELIIHVRPGYFFEGLSHNSSIRKISLCNIYGWGGLGHMLFQKLVPFFKNNRNLEEIDIDVGDARGDAYINARDYQLMAMAIGECSGSLTKFSFRSQRTVSIIGGSHYGSCDYTNCIPLALSMHPKLRKIHLNGVYIGRSACIAFGTLFRNSATELEDLYMQGNGTDDEGVLALVDGLSHCNKLSRFYLYSDVGTISNIGWKSLSTLLEFPSSSLERLRLNVTTITDDGAQMMANALKCNKNLKILSLDYEEGDIGNAWSVFTKVVCDITNISSTFQSNHTINEIGAGRRLAGRRVPRKLKSLLSLNKDINKKQVAMTKILKHHRHFTMKPFFEWDLKLLPLVISWFERAAGLATDFETHIGERKLFSIYQFVRAMPMLAILLQVKFRVSE